MTVSIERIQRSPLYNKLINLYKAKKIELIFILLFTIPLIIHYKRPVCVSYGYIKYKDVHKVLFPCSLSRNASFCPVVPPALSDDIEIKTSINNSLISNLKTTLGKGGHWRPHSCVPLYKTAIIAPYRDRPRQLQLFLQHMHPFLQSQQIEYGIFIVEQSSSHAFNRGKLLNIGFKEASLAGDYCCFIFHDIDLLPQNPMNIYGCSHEPRHLCSSIDSHRFVLMYPDIFGGVVAFTKDQFSRINGFSNKFFGWGGEDDDLSFRVRGENYEIQRWDPWVSRYSMLYHKAAVPNPKRWSLLAEQAKHKDRDGLNSLKYEVLKYDQLPLYTRILVDVNP